ncbi:hypothetical protein Tco_0936974 [Tanacetum coccineum]|uniref:Uncharacterized protein n=1 Tax=Tanacetum coccineum TaxID=301880 RepID=A0ABQ5DJ41_9ASTR
MKYEFSSVAPRIFLRRLGERFKLLGGNFLYKSPTEGLQIIENKAKVRCSRNAVMRVSTNAPPFSSNSSSNFEFQQMAAALEDKTCFDFWNED